MALTPINTVGTTGAINVRCATGPWFISGIGYLPVRTV